LPSETRQRAFLLAVVGEALWIHTPNPCGSAYWTAQTVLSTLKIPSGKHSFPSLHEGSRSPIVWCSNTLLDPGSFSA